MKPILDCTAVTVISFLINVKIMCAIMWKLNISRDILCTCAMFVGLVVQQRYLCKRIGESFIKRKSISAIKICHYNPDY